MKVIAVLILFVACVAAGLQDFKVKTVHPRDRTNASSFDSRITNGLDAAAGQFPYQVALEFTGLFSSWFCGGVIIDNCWILTAAHCTDEALYVKIFYGALSLSSPAFTETVYALSFKQHILYSSSSLKYDISLIKTPHVAFNSAIDKVKLPSISATPQTYEGNIATTSGWGYTSDYNPNLAGTLQYIDLEVISNTECESVYGAVISDSNLCCKTDNGISTCSGDSGGPLTWYDGITWLIGITAFGSSEGCQKNYPVGFTRITQYLHWIKDNSGIYTP
ncbi:serine protease 1-like [Drosophila ficusphila]|uniref:serine protease 1-like n=1 Tax=Drosophila ficusphila TaxID=30025 RepID=UPI0007E82951|nr:serine protease 1-like [Drosophila ficusphila]